MRRFAGSIERSSATWNPRSELDPKRWAKRGAGARLSEAATRLIRREL